MNWIVVKKFPLDTDLTHISGFLHERAIQHKIYEDAGEQVIAVADPRLVGPITQFLHEVAQGHLVIEAEPAEVQSPKAASAPSLPAQMAQAPVSVALILLSALGAILVGLDANLTLVRWFTYQDIVQDNFIPLQQSLAQGQLWRVITPAFLHFSFLHVLFNSLWMWDLGRRLELLLGGRKYLVFFLVTAAISNTAQYLWADASLFGGMSGVVYALVGFIMVRHRLAPHSLTAVPASIIGFMLFWLALCMTGVVDHFVGGGVANAAHLGGLLAGCAYALLTLKNKS